MKKKTTIEELEKILNSEEEVAIYIRPDGSLTTKQKKRGKKLLTMGESNLGGEY